MNKLVAVALLFAAAYVEAFTIARKGQPPECAIVIPQPTTEAVKYAQEELRLHVERMTGVKLDFATDAQPLPDCAILLGNTRWTKELLGEDFDMAKLGTDGFRLVVKGNRLLVLGSDVRGALYGTYELLERFGGCGWYSSTCSVVPEREEFSVSDGLGDTQVPAFTIRSTSWAEASRNPKHAVRLRLNDFTNPSIPLEYGGSPYRFAKRAGIAHTFQGLLPSHEWFPTHPEYFCEVDGKRRSGNETQPCLTNPDVLRIVVSNVFDRLAADPYARMVGVSQNDNRMYCRCAKCAAVDEEEGANTGTLLRFVNAVAEEVEKKRPDVLVQTLIYQYTRTPPKHVRPRHNVVPCLCAIECGRARPIPDRSSVADSRFMDDLEAWGKLTDHLYLWDYSTNYRNLLYPMPIEHTFQENLRAYRKNRVKYMFMEGSGSYHCDFGELKAWLAAKLMWNPDQDEKPLLDRFFAGYYGAAAPFVREYFERCRAEIKARPGQRLGIFNQKPPPWYNADFAQWARGVFAKAEAAVANDPMRLTNVRYTGLAPVVTELDRFVSQGKRFFVTRHPEKYSVPEAKKLDYAYVMDLVRQARDNERPMRFCAGLTWEPCKMIEWKLMYGRAKEPVPRDSITLAGVDLFVVSGRHVKRVRDKEGTSSKTVLQLLPSSGKPMVTLNFANVAFDAGVPYKVRFRAKVVRDGGDGAAFRATLAKAGAPVEITNIGESQGSKGAGEAIEKRVSEVEDGYRWYEFRPVVLTPKHVFEFGSGPWERGGGIGATKEVRLDCVEISRAETGTQKAKGLR